MNQNVHNTNFYNHGHFKGKTHKSFFKNQRDNHRSGHHKSFIKDDQSFENPSDCNTVCSVNLANDPSYIAIKQRNKSSITYTSKKQGLIFRQASLLKEKNIYRDSSIAKGSQIIRLTKEVTQLKKQNAKLRRINKNFEKVLYSYKQMLNQMKQQLNQQQSFNGKDKILLQRYQGTKQDNEINFAIFQGKIQYLQEQLGKLNQYSNKIQSIRQENMRLIKESQEKQLFYTQMIQKSQEQLASAKKQINRLNVQLDGINRKHYYYIQRQRQKFMQQKQKYNGIKFQMNQLYSDLKKLENTQKMKREMQVRIAGYDQNSFTFRQDSIFSNQN